MRGTGCVAKTKRFIKKEDKENMNEVLFMVLAFLAGVCLGIIFFGGLWITVQRALKSNMPGLWFAGGLLSRLTVTMLGFYFVGAGNWQRLLICTAGFIVARFIVMHYTKKIDELRIEIRKEAVHET